MAHTVENKLHFEKMSVSVKYKMFKKMGLIWKNVSHCYVWNKFRKTSHTVKKRVTQ